MRKTPAAVPKSCLFIPALLLACAFSCSGAPQSAKKQQASAEKALELYYKGRIEEAASEFEAVLEKEKDNAAIKRQLAVIYRETGNYSTRARFLEELTGSGENLLPELFTAYYLSGDIKKAAEYREAAEKAVRSAGAAKRAYFLLIDAMLYKEEGNTKQAVERFRESLALESYRPVAWFNLGELVDDKEAETYYRRALSQDGAFTRALYPLGKILAARKAWAQAEDILGRAARRYPDDRRIAAALAEVRRNVRGGGEERLSIRKITANPLKVKPLMNTPGEGRIRIGLAEKRQLVSVKAGGAFTISAEGPVVYRGAAREQFWVVRHRDGALAFQDENGNVFLRSGKKLTLTYNDSGDTSIAAGIVSGSPAINRGYRGDLEFISTPDGITVVNILNTEEYLYGVIPAEMPSGWPPEALKAQAIAARSYSIAQLGQFADRGFDLYGTPYSMAYHGVGAETKHTTFAVDATRGIVLKGGAKPLKAYFSANHGGYSEDSLTMWGYDAYMAAVPDITLNKRTSLLPLNELDDWIHDAPFSFSSVNRYHFSSSYRWEKWVEPDEIRRRLRENRGEDPGEVQRIISRGRGISGRVYELEVKGSRKSVFVKGDAIWPAMGALRSSLFTVSYKFDKNQKLEYVIFRGAGHGHGIGLDQHGAAGMASAGYNAEQILRHYYPKAEITRL